jgi:hypothetical protein
MSRRNRILAALGVVGLLALGTWQAFPPREPLYEGKPLRYWLASEDREKATGAMEHFGTNAIPQLLKMIQAKDGPAMEALVNSVGRLARRLNYYHSIPIGAETTQERGCSGFSILGSNATPAIPALSNLLARGETRLNASIALACIGVEA